MKERELRAYEYQSPKMYEHVGMADNHHKHRSDERQMTSFDHFINNEQRTMKSQLSKITKHEGTKTKNYSTKTQSSRQQASKFKDQDHKERSQ